MQCCALKQRAVAVLSLYLQSASPYPRKTGMEARDLGRVRLHEIYKESEILPENFGDEIVAELEERFLEDGYEITKKNAIEEMLWCYMCKMQ